MPASDPLTTTAFRLQIAGSIADRQLHERLAVLRIKPKHVTLLSALRLGAPGSQLELAELLHVAPSVIVTFADHLESLGAITRERDPHDRRRQLLVLTDHGRTLLAESYRIAAELDAELLTSVARSDRPAVERFLARLVSAAGVPTATKPPAGGAS